MLQDKPFRTTVQQIEKGEIARINRQEGYQHARKLEPVKKALKRIKNQSHANWERKKSWIYHPDERVPLNMLELGHRCPDWDKLRRYLTRSAAPKAARKENVLWTPLLDKIQLKRENRQRMEGHSQTTELLEELGEWLSQLDGPTPARELMQFRSRRVREVACRHVSQVDAWWFHQAWGNPHLMAQLAENPATPKTFTRRIEEYFLEEMKTWHRRDQQEDVKNYHKMQNRIEAARKGLEGVEKGVGLQPHTLEEAVQLVRMNSNHYKRQERESWVERKLRDEMCLLVSRLEHNTPTHEQLLHLFQASRPHQRALQDIIRQNDLPLKLIRTIAADDNLSHWHDYLIQHRQEVGKDPQTRQALLQSPSKTALQRMCRKVQPDELPVLVERVAQLLRRGKTEYSKRSGTPGSRMLHVLIDQQGEHLTEEQLLKLHQKVYKDSSTVCELICLPGAGPRLWEAALDGSTSIKIREKLANHPPARQTRVVWERLIRSTSKSLLEDLGLEAQGQRLRTVIQKLLNADVDSRYIQQFITEMLDPQQRQDIKPQDLKPLLEAQNHQQRRKGLRLLAQVGPKKDQSKTADETTRDGRIR